MDKNEMLQRSGLNSIEAAIYVVLLDFVREEPPTCDELADTARRVLVIARAHLYEEAADVLAVSPVSGPRNLDGFREAEAKLRGEAVRRFTSLNARD